MTITTTAIGFSLLSLGLAFCGFRFFKAFQKIGDSRAGRKIGILLSVFLLSFASANGLLAAGSLFFTESSEALYIFLLVSDIILMMVAALGAYLVFYIFFPVISPWPGTIAAFAFGSSVVILTAVTHPLPFLDSGSVIDFNLSRGLSILLAYLLFVSIGSVFAIFVRLFLQAKSYEVRIVSFLMSILALMGIVNAFFRYLLPRSTASNFLQIRTFDVTHVVIGLVFIVVFLLPPIIIKQISRTRNRQT